MGVITDPKKLLGFLEESLDEKRPVYFTRSDPKAKRYAERVTGETFEKQILDGKRDALMLIFHPNPEKNRGLKEKFQTYA